MAAVMLQVISSFYAKYSKSNLLIFANTYEKHIVSKEYCIAHHDAIMCFLPNCRYHILLFGNVEQLLQKLDHCVSHINTWTVSIHCSSIDSIEILLSRVAKCQVFANMQRAFYFNQRNRGVDRMPSNAKRDSWGNSTKNAYWDTSKRPNRRKLVDQSWETKLNKLERQNSI